MKNLKSFTLGVITTTLIATCGVSALAASGAISISVNPNITIKVNGDTFKPKDVNGKDVMVFEYNGTTYAPLRALAEAYGLQVGWDQAAQMATVNDPGSESTQTGTNPISDAPDISNDAGYLSFKSNWNITEGRVQEENPDRIIFSAFYSGKTDPKEYWNSIDSDTRNAYSFQLYKDHVSEYSNYSFHTVNLYIIVEEKGISCGGVYTGDDGIAVIKLHDVKSN